MSGLYTRAEGANLEQAKPDETLRQKDPVSDLISGKFDRLANTLPDDNTDGVTLVDWLVAGPLNNLSGHITEARETIFVRLFDSPKP